MHIRKCVENVLLCLVARSCPTLCNPMDCSPPGSSVHGILQARILEWLPCLPPWDIPSPGIKSASPALQVGSLSTEPPGKPRRPWTLEDVGVSGAGSRAGALPVRPALPCFSSGMQRLGSAGICLAVGMGHLCGPV